MMLVVCLLASQLVTSCVRHNPIDATPVDATPERVNLPDVGKPGEEKLFAEAQTNFAVIANGEFSAEEGRRIYIVLQSILPYMESTLGVSVETRILVDIYPNKVIYMKKTNASSRSNGTVTCPNRNPVISLLAPVEDYTIRHEVVHAVACIAWGSKENLFPTWYIEGLAEFLSVGNDKNHRPLNYLGKSKIDSSYGSTLCYTQRLLDEHDWDVFYGAAYRFVLYIAEKIGIPALIDIGNQTYTTRGFEVSLQSVTGLVCNQLYEKWFNETIATP